MGAFDRFIAAASKKYGVPPEYLQKLIQYESKGDPNAISPTGARGLGQFTGTTGAQYGLNRRNINDPAANIDATARYARDNYRTLEKGLGRPPTVEEVYLGHLQGPTGAISGLKNPNARAVDLWDPNHVRVNLPASRRGDLNTITAKEYQDLHRGNFNNAGSPREPGTIDIGTTPDLKTLNPNANPSKSPFTKPVIPLSQLAPTEAQTMARPRTYDDAIRTSMDEISDGGRVRYAGAITGAARPKVTKIPKSEANKAVQKAAEDEAAGVGARRGTPDAPRQMEGNYGDYVAKEKARMEAERLAAEKRAQELRNVPSAEEQIRSGSGTPVGGPDNPRGVPTTSYRRPAAAIPAAAAGAAATGVGASDPAVTAVQQAINGPGADPTLAAQNDPASQAALAARMRGGRGSAAAPPPEAVGPRRTNPMSPENPDTTRDILSQAMPQVMQQAAPVIKNAMQDPQVAQAAKVVAGGLIKSKAQMDAHAADQQNDPTYYQMMASRGQMPGAQQDDRAMERAVMMDNQRMMQQRGASSARGMPPQATPGRVPNGQEQIDVGPATRGPVEQGDQSNTENQIVQQALNPQSVYTKRYRPTADKGPADPRGAYGYPLSPGSGDVSGGVQGMPNAGQMPMDPAMQQLMQFFTQGGGGVG